MAGYYRKFCETFSERAAPLTDLLKKGNRFRWTDECQEAFDDAKKVLGPKPVLRALDFEQPFCLAGDASDAGIGALLMHSDENNRLRPVSYYSRKLKKFQKSYSTIEKEALALLRSVHHFHVYVSSSLVNFLRIKNNRRLQEWELACRSIT